ncbi:MAG: glycosyl hydrolase [Terracidiphilus sp.]|nr:glycosyl hydrolase [Terracidiphilus sp.]
MRFFWTQSSVCVVVCAALAFVVSARPGAAQKAAAKNDASADSLTTIRSGFATPPMDARPMMRWWWFGPAVEKGELARELRTMKAGGIGGVEVQPVYALELNDPQKGFRNLPFLSKDFLDMVSFTAQTTHDLGLRLSFTLGSGWPYGGAYVPVSDAAGRLRIVAEAVPPGASSLPVPSIRNGEALLAAFLASGTPQNYDADRAQQLDAIRDLRLTLPTGISGPHVVLFFISSRTGQQVKRAAVGAEGFVLDHFSMEAIQNHIQHVADPLIAACGPNVPYSVFSDSLEVYESDWTPKLLDEFRKRRGYELTPHLPELVAGTSPEAADLRYDWGRTLAELVDEHYLTPLNTWAREHHTKFRSQSYGSPAVTLSSNALVDLPEGEGSQWHGGFSFTRWATSASHVYGRPITSSETWTWLHSPSYRATPLDMKAEADTFFLQGINQFVGHGWPYSPPSAGDPGWSFYAAAVFNDHNPWWMVMPDVMSYFTRVSYLLRQGAPANDIAVLLPEEDGQARFRPGHVSVTDEMRILLGPDLVPAILDAGYNFDFIDAAAIDKVGIKYPVLVVPATERLPLVTYKKIREFAAQGGRVIAVGTLPSRAPGVTEGPRDSAAVAQISQTLADLKNVKIVASVAEVGPAIGAALKPDVAIAPATPEVGFIHRKLPNAEVYFIANTGNSSHAFDATFRTSRIGAEWWDPMTGNIMGAGAVPTLHFDLAPYESRVVVFSDRVNPAPQYPATRPFAPIDLSHDWKVTFNKSGTGETMQTLHSWTDYAAQKYYSGTAIYTRTVEIPETVAKSGRVLLDFGEGTPVPRQQLRLAGTRTWYDPPVREVAVVSVNGKPAGDLWHPPYRLDVTALLHAGTNELRIVVANTAINELAGRDAPDYRLLNLRYGEKFTPQDMDHLQPLPSGILGTVRLISGNDAQH